MQLRCQQEVARECGCRLALGHIAQGQHQPPTRAQHAHHLADRAGDLARELLRLKKLLADHDRWHVVQQQILENEQLTNGKDADLAELLGPRPAAVARELTKLHEEIFRGSLEEAIAHFEAQPPRGEITLVVAGYTARQERWSR